MTPRLPARPGTSALVVSTILALSALASACGDPVLDEPAAADPDVAESIATDDSDEERAVDPPDTVVTSDADGGAEGAEVSTAKESPDDSTSAPATAVEAPEPATTVAGATGPVEATPAESPVTSASPAPSDASCTDIRRDLGADVVVVDGRCEGGWAYVETDDLGDAQFIARVSGDRWVGVVYFPTFFLCEDDLTSVGAPPAVVGGVNWSCSQPAPRDVNYTDDGFEGDLDIGSRGPRVRALQIEMARRGFGSLVDADEYYGPGTQSRVARFQLTVGLVASGRADEETRRALGVFEGARPLPAGSVVLDGTGIDGARLGDGELAAEATLVALLGPPHYDTAYDPDYFDGFPCSPSVFRSVRWGPVDAQFGDRGNGRELLHLGVFGEATGIVSPEGIETGAPVEVLESAGGDYSFDEIYAWSYSLPSGVTGNLEDDTLSVRSMNAGYFPCGE